MNHRLGWYVCVFALLLVVSGAPDSLYPRAAAAVDDSTAPKVTFFSLTPTQVDTTSENQWVTVSVALTDDLVGVCTQGDTGGYWGGSSMLRLIPPSGTQAIYLHLKRVSGDHLNGVYTATAPLPRGSTKGPWTVGSLQLADKLGNTVQLSSAQLETQFGVGATTIANVAAVDDSNPPQITSFAISPREVDTSSSDQTVTVTVGLTDDSSGVPDYGEDGRGSSLMRMNSYGNPDLVFTPLVRLSGSDRDGIYTAKAILPKGSASGQFSVVSCWVTDRLGNRFNLLSYDIERRLGPGVARFTNTAPAGDPTSPGGVTSDRTRPVITSFNFSSRQINTSESSQMVTVTVAVSDDLSGIGGRGGADGSVSVRICPLIGTQEWVVPLARVSGDDLNGVYQGTRLMPRYSKEGIWTVDWLYAYDRLQNTTVLDADALSAVLADSSGTTFANTAESDKLTIDRQWTIATPRTTVTFPAGTEVSRAEGGSFEFYRMASMECSVDGTSLAEGLIGEPVGMLRFGIPGLGLSFSKPVVVSMNVGHKYEGYCMQIQSLREGDAQWANETQVTVVDGKCTFTTNHATYYAASIVRVAPALSNPIAASSTYRGMPITVYGSLKPRHSVGTYPVRVYSWRKTSNGSWKSYGYVSARVSNYSNYSNYSRSLSFPSAGQWRIRAYAPADAKHTAAWSSEYDYVTVKGISIGTPVAPSVMKRGVTKTVYGILNPRHAPGSRPVRLYRWRKVSGKWKAYGYVSTRATNYSTYTKYAGSVRLPYAGTWRLRAYAPADSKHPAIWSPSYDFVSVK